MVLFPENNFNTREDLNALEKYKIKSSPGESDVSPSPFAPFCCSYRVWLMIVTSQQMNKQMKTFIY